MGIETIILIGLAVLAGFYLAWNIGANDVANAMGTSVGSGALTLKRAVILAAILEFSGAFFFGSNVSETVQKGIVNTDLFIPDPYILVYGMIASLIATGAWLQIATYYGWPVSTTHSIVGALVGFGAFFGGVEGVNWERVFFIVSSWILSPICGAVIAYFIFTFLRTHILATQSPLQAAKNITPILSAIVALILTFSLLYYVLNGVLFEFTVFKALGISLGVGIIGMVISASYVRKLKKSHSPMRDHSIYNPEIAASLDKAKKHLLQAQTATSGELNYHLSTLIEEISGFSHALKKTETGDLINSEYTAVEKIFSYLQIISACLMAFAHGANDVANAIGPLSAAIHVLTSGVISETTQVPAWALGLGGVGIVAGLATWGWRVIETVGKKITELTPTRGFAAEFSAAMTIVAASQLGMPISTTHTLVGAVIGVGFARGIEALNLSTMRDIIISWIVTVPVGAGLGIVFCYLLKGLFS